MKKFVSLLPTLYDRINTFLEKKKKTDIGISLFIILPWKFVQISTPTIYINLRTNVSYACSTYLNILRKPHSNNE